MIEPATILLTLGVVLLLGLATNALGRLTRLPRVTLLLGFGIAIGPEGFNFLPAHSEAWFELAADMALVMVGFLLGEQFTRKHMRHHGREVLVISLSAVVATCVAVAAGLHLLLDVPLEAALLFGAIASSTAPAATMDVVHESGAMGPFSHTLLGVVAVDDAWGLIAFSLALIAVGAAGANGDLFVPLGHAVHDIGGALLLGAALGVPAAYLTGRIRSGEPTQLEALGLVLLCGGLALKLEVSFLLAAMTLGAVVANLARHYRRPFHAIENIEQPFLVLFFVFAGASLELESLLAIGWLGGGYVLLRIAGRFLGAWIGGGLCGWGIRPRNSMGMALMPQAGVALGMALIASQRLPEYEPLILPVVIGATVFFELSGPILARLALRRMGESA